MLTQRNLRCIQQRIGLPIARRLQWFLQALAQRVLHPAYIGAVGLGRKTDDLGVHT
jgi:hypothetical protein